MKIGPVTVSDLPSWLLARVPAIEGSYRIKVEQQYRDEPDETPDSYFIFSFVLKPHVKHLLEAGDHSEVQRIFDLLENLANHGDSMVQCGLEVMMEEVDVSQIAAFLGPKMTEWEFARVSWYPHGPKSADNRHVDADQYRQRWRDEIEKIGGLGNLTLANHLMIRHELVTEFGIIGMRAPEPGGPEWLAMKLPWPYSRTTA